MDLTNNSNFVRIILLPEFKIPEPEEEPTMSPSKCLKAEKTWMIFFIHWTDISSWPCLPGVFLKYPHHLAILEIH